MKDWEGTRAGRTVTHRHRHRALAAQQSCWRRECGSPSPKTKQLCDKKAPHQNWFAIGGGCRHLFGWFAHLRNQTDKSLPQAPAGLRCRGQRDQNAARLQTNLQVAIMNSEKKNAGNRVEDCITDRIECFVKGIGGPIKKERKL